MKKHIYADDRGNKWGWLKDLEIGEESEPLASGRETVYIMAKRAGIRVTTRQLPSGDYVVRRLANEVI